MPIPFRPSSFILETDVAAGASPGWISGTLSSLAASASVTILFDLGPNWDVYPGVAISVAPLAPSSGLTAVKIMSSDTTTVNAARVCPAAASGVFAGLNVAITVAGGAQSITVRPMGRYLFVQATNADAINALGASSKVTMGASTS